MSEIKNEIILDILDFVFVKIKYLSWLESRMLRPTLEAIKSRGRCLVTNRILIK